MKYRKIRNSELKVSEICLGSMTWGEQNTEKQAHEQLNYAFDQGVNFIDTAEMYPVPPKAETYTRTETIIGNWLNQRNKRDQVVLATKAAGSGDWLSYIRKGPNFSRQQINEAIEGSLRRLQTDYIDLYQLHWPERTTNFFGVLGYEATEDSYTPFEEVLETLKDLVIAGKIRHIGLSNETPWGTMQFLQLAKERNLPATVSVQNPYNLLNRTYEIGMAEISHRENVGLLAYSPLAFGVLSGKYLNDQRPDNARLTLFKRFSRYTNPQATRATELYIELAKRHGLSPSQMALAYINSRPFLLSNIIGATNMEQLKENIASKDVILSKDVIEGIEQIHQQHPNPAP